MGSKGAHLPSAPLSVASSSPPNSPPALRRSWRNVSSSVVVLSSDSDGSTTQPARKRQKRQVYGSRSQDTIAMGSNGGDRADARRINDEEPTRQETAEGGVGHRAEDVWEFFVRGSKSDNTKHVCKVCK
jgi:hypothetical protein